MNEADTKRLEEIKVRVRNDGYWPPGAEVAWVIARLEAEAQENERLQQRERDLIGLNDIDVHEGMAWCDRAKAAEARLVESEGVSLLREKGGKVWERQAHEAEATCQSLRDQSSLWEAQALEAGQEVERQSMARIAIEEAFMQGRLPLGIPCKPIDDAIARAEAAEARCAKLEAKCREYETSCSTFARAYGEGPISNTSEPQGGKGGSMNYLSCPVCGMMQTCRTCHPVPSPLLPLVRELRDFLVDDHDSYLATNGEHKFARACPTCALLARADKALADAEPQEGKP